MKNNVIESSNVNGAAVKRKAMDVKASVRQMNISIYEIIANRLYGAFCIVVLLERISEKE